VALTAGPEPQIEPGDAGSVRVTAQSSATVDAAWRALTEPARVGQWFGGLSGELVPGARVRLDFDDGDFFDLEVDEVARPALRWTWRFMGCGPRDTIEVSVEECDRGSIITVIDSEPSRSRDEALALGEGWRDFTTRLQRYLANGERARYDWRSEVDVWIELPVDADLARRLVISAAGDWLPLPPGTPNLIVADAVVLDDGEQPAEFAVDRVHGDGPAAVRFELKPAGLDGSLSTRIEIAPRGNGATLAISQTGFRELCADDAVQRRIRERFAGAWLAAARRARELVSERSLAQAQAQS
jgi:uncharacterized protein YndB with AHSA1/START domain